ncbi:hypothetical protein K8Q80_12625 [Escherichia coli]|uniref:hypothetical protein n=1 Tax=Escherichia coli TaxID=562 RepID=UPI0016593A64|nr:hypothetical protein [Escherichia coli]MBC9551532.1 hypothetical protein [Escherichia coli]MDF2161594.1 hypothetical protein [Escherichia coli]MDJ1233647.1 hypothetical protein [Escherichia coli]MDJ1281843.1 hypothetical protein [Escherichia coli]MDJ1290717.1 hypothetical protein [Escherichia coli]
MKQMSLIEMDGFLKGKCIPRDLKVNETNAEYLVRKFAEVEAKCAALAAENARCLFEVSRCHQTVDEMFHHKDKWFDKEWLSALWSTSKRLMENTPATDAFLAEVRAQGVDAAIETAKNLVAQEYEYKDFKAAQSDCCMHPGSDLVGKVEMTEWLVDFAAQLRKGGNR